VASLQALCGVSFPAKHVNTHILFGTLCQVNIAPPKSATLFEHFARIVQSSTMSFVTRAEFDVLAATVEELQRTVEAISNGVYRAAAAQMHQVHTFLALSAGKAAPEAPAAAPRASKRAVTKRDDQEVPVPKKPRSETTRRCGTCGGGGHNARTCKAFLDAPAPEEEDAAPHSSPAYEPPHAVLAIPNSANEEEETPFAEGEAPVEDLAMPEPSVTKEPPTAAEETLLAEALAQPAPNAVVPATEEALVTTEDEHVLPEAETLVVPPAAETQVLAFEEAPEVAMAETQVLALEEAPEVAVAEAQVLALDEAPAPPAAEATDAETVL